MSLHRSLPSLCLAVAITALPSSCKRSAPESENAPPPNTFSVESAPTVSAESLAAARTVYASRCAMCHGPAGRGDGPMARALTVRPQDLSDRLWQSNRSNQRLGLVIVSGGPAIGKSPLMPGQPDLAAQPATVDGLVAILRGFARAQ